MNKIRFVFHNFVVFGTLVFGALGVEAAPRAFVSTGGNDANSCARNQPCRTFAAAVNAVDAGGEVIVLDSGNYGAVTITKAVSIIAPDGVVASVGQSFGNAIIVAAGASDTVVLRGLTLKSNGGGFGINFDSGAALFVENCTISNFFRGILFDAAGKLTVENTILRNNFVGVLTGTESGNIQAVINRTTVTGSGGTGVFLGANTKTLITDSTASGNTFTGFSVSRNGVLTISRSAAANNGQHGFVSEGGATAILNADYCTATSNGGAGFIAGGGSQVIVRVSNSTATDNAVGFDKQNVSVFESYGNNRVRGNTTNFSGTITVIGEN